LFVTAKVADKWFDPHASRIVNHLPQVDSSILDSDRASKAEPQATMPQASAAGGQVPQSPQTAKGQRAALPLPNETDAATDPTLGKELDKILQEQERKK